MQVDREWFDRDPVELAPLLLGATLSRHDAHGTVAVRITEVEAYRGADDPGAHTYRGPTARNRTMFGEGGHLYCYFTYGMHHALNVVAGPAGVGQGVLVRAGSVTAGEALARVRRRARRRTEPPVELASGPGNLAACFDADLAVDGTDLLDPEGEWSLDVAEPVPHRRGPRVGVSGIAGTDAFDWRFAIPGEPSVSRYRAAVPRRRAR